MKTLFCRCKKVLAGVLICSISPLLSAAGTSSNSGYTEMNLVSDVSSNATRVDPRLVNAWGLVAAPNALWVSDNHSGLLTVYGPMGTPVKISVNVPAPGGGTGAPTGLVLNDSKGFAITNGSRVTPSTYLTATEDGTVVAWNQSGGSNGVIVVNNSDAIYKGLAIARDTNDAPILFLANFHSGMVEMYDANFQLLGSFRDADLPGDYGPFNVRTIRGRVFVTYAKQDSSAEDDSPGPGNGYLDIFDTDGTLLRRFASGGALNSPWGMAIAPKSFGKFSHALLVGNFGDGMINGYDLLTGKWLGALSKPDGSPLQIDGLWALAFEKDETPGQESNYSAQRLYFTAGPNGENDGLLGILRPVSPSFPPAR